MSTGWNLISGLFLMALLVGCPTRDPYAVNANCPSDAPCFLSVLAPRGQTAAPGPYNLVVEVTGPHRIEGVGLVMSINGAASLQLNLARMTSGNGLWGVPDLESDSIVPADAIETTKALARLQPGDSVSFILWAWDQMGNQTEWTGDGRSDTGSITFEIVDSLAGSQLPDAGPATDAAAPTSDAALGVGDAGTETSVDATSTPTVDAG